jgi:hydrogenase/urease accessory protein HupE
MSRITRSCRIAAALLFAHLAFLLATTASGSAHEVRPAYLQIDQIAQNHFNILWRTPNLLGMRLPVLLEFSEGIKSETEPSERLLADSAVERRIIEVEGSLAGERISFVGLEATNTDVVVRVNLEDRPVSTTLVRPSQPWIDLTGRQTTWQVARSHTRLGIEHILMGVDHLLFVTGLMIIVGSIRALVKTITAFTIAHSITLALATLGYASVPMAPLNAAIALSILFLGIEIVRLWRGQTSFTLRHPWVAALVFGLLHGFGFASGLTTLGLPSGDIPLALLAFNMGVEIGQLAFVFVTLLLYHAWTILRFDRPGWVRHVPGYLVGSLGAFWTIERTVLLF